MLPQPKVRTEREGHGGVWVQGRGYSNGYMQGKEGTHVPQPGEGSGVGSQGGEDGGAVGYLCSERHSRHELNHRAQAAIGRKAPAISSA